MTDSELKQILDESEAFWRQVAIDNHHAPIVRPLRHRPPSLCDKPHLCREQGQWICDCHIALTGDYYLYTADTPHSAYQQLVNAINHALDWDKILSANFIYIDHVLICYPAFVFKLLPPAIQEQYAN